VNKSHKQYFNDLAPDWEAKMPTRPEFRDYIKRFGVSDGDMVLDIGAGTGRMSRLLLDEVGSENCVVAQDFALDMLREAKIMIPSLGKSLVCENVQALAYADDTFDKVLCFSAFPHFTDQLLALKEMGRVLKPQGKLLILHNRSSEGLNAFHNSLSDPVNQDSLPHSSELSNMIVRTGLKPVRIEESENLYWVEAVKP